MDDTRREHCGDVKANLEVSDPDSTQDITHQELLGSQERLPTHLVDLLVKLSPEQRQELIEVAMRVKESR